MIALGWAPGGIAPPPPLAAVDLTQCALIAAAGEAAATPRDRLALQVACARALPSFLPLRPSDTVTLDEAISRSRVEAASIAARLADLAGRVQVTLCADWTASAPARPNVPSAGDGRDWLAARAARHAALADRRTELATVLRAALAARMAGPVQERPRPSGLQLDGLVDAAGVEAGLAALAGDLDCLGLRHPVRLTVTGPWPVLSFSDTARCAA